MTKPLIGIIIEGKKGFTPIIGYAVEMGEDEDGPIFDVYGKQSPQKTVEEAQKFLIDETTLNERLLTSVKSAACSIGGIIWLDEIRKAQV